MTDKYVELELQLAEAMGKKVSRIDETGTIWVRNDDGSMSWLPWAARDNAAACALMIEHSCYPCAIGNLVGINGSMAETCVRVNEHATKEHAVRSAIVLGVIAKLKKERHG